MCVCVYVSEYVCKYVNVSVCVSVYVSECVHLCGENVRGYVKV